MNNDFVIISDSNSETPLSVVKAHELDFVPMPYTIEGEEHCYDLGEKTDLDSFYTKVRQGAMPSTSTYPPQYYIDKIRPYLEDGKDVLFISFSSNLSAAYEFLSTACAQLQEEYKDRRIVALDTLRISGAMALLLCKALEMKADGSTMDDLIEFIEQRKQFSNAYFVVDDLNHLLRGGRISATTAVVGGMLSIKPMLCITNEGKIVNIDKCRGRKKSLRKLAQTVINRVIDPEQNTLFIMHADSLEDAGLLREMIEESISFKEIIVQYVGPVIGSHCGPGTIAACFMGEEM